MSKFLAVQQKYALEMLEIEKLIEEDKEAQGSAFDVALQDAKESTETKSDGESDQDQPEPAVDAAPADSDSDASSGERVTGDDESSDADSPDQSSDEDKPDDEKKDDKSLESMDPMLRGLREVFDDRIPTAVITMETLRERLSSPIFALEFYDGQDSGHYSEKRVDAWEHKDFVQWGSDKASTAGMGEKLKWLGQFGIKFTTETLPKLAKSAYKGAIYSFDKLAYAYSLGMTALEQYIQRRANSFDSLKKDIDKAKAAAKLLSHANPEDMEHLHYKDARGIQQLVIGNDTNLLAHLDLVEKFLETAVTDLSASIKEDLQGIEQLISHSSIPDQTSVLSLMAFHVKLKNLTQGEVDGFATKSQLLQPLRSKYVLPGNVVLICHLPTEHDKSREEWIQACRESEIFLGVDRKSFKSVDQIAYLEPSELTTLLDKLHDLNETCMKHAAFYEGMKNAKIHQRLIYKAYFDSVIRRSSKTGLKESLVDLVTAKNNFIDKVYLPGAIDIHDYVAKTIRWHLRFVAKNLEVLKP